MTNGDWLKMFVRTNFFIIPGHSMNVGPYNRCLSALYQGLLHISSYPCRLRCCSDGQVHLWSRVPAVRQPFWLQGHWTLHFPQAEPLLLLLQLCAATRRAVHRPPRQHLGGAGGWAWVAVIVLDSSNSVILNFVFVRKVMMRCWVWFWRNF